MIFVNEMWEGWWGEGLGMKRTMVDGRGELDERWKGSGRGWKGWGDEAGRTGSELPPKPSCCPNSLRRMMMMMIL